jgi:D-serine deaminase-like pyridoxal phosphate-dependent protein
MKRLTELETPALVLDRGVLQKNCARMSARMTQAGVRLRPHLKTSKSAKVAEIATRGHFGGITVSTIAEARYFVAHGVRDITYAIGLAAAKLDAVAALQAQGAAITLLCDNLAALEAAGEKAAELNADFRILIEVDTGGLRGGVLPDSEELIALGRFLSETAGLSLAGVLTHAGNSYHCRSRAEIEAVAEAERSGIVLAAQRLRDAGFTCETVSAGSTPTAICARSFEGVTEMRPGVYGFFDLDQMALGVCEMEDIALSVVATVIGHNHAAGRILIDAGGLALSKDLSATEFLDATGYGLVCPLGSTRPMAGLYVESVHQEHGLIAAVDGALPYETLPVGSRVRILPNHACMTAAAYNSYHVVDGGEDVVETWDRVNGWY